MKVIYSLYHDPLETATQVCSTTLEDAELRAKNRSKQLNNKPVFVLKTTQTTFDILGPYTAEQDKVSEALT